jgi:cytochrome c-type biogenesis protein CcmF
MVAVLMAVPIGPLLAWKRGDLPAALQRLLAAAAVVVVAVVTCLALVRRGPWLAPFGIALGVWVVAGAATEWAGRIKLLAAPLRESMGRARGLPRATYGSLLGHAGLGITVIGIVATSAWQSETVLALKPGERGEVAGYAFVLRGTETQRGPNYTELAGRVEVTRGGAPVVELRPSKRLFDTPRQVTTETAIHASWLGDLYVVLGDELTDGGFVVRAYFNPLVRFIWLGAAVMALGGVLSLLDRRLRIGAPRRSARADTVPAPSPAE